MVLCFRLQDAGGVQPDGEDLQLHERRLHGARLLQQLHIIPTPQERLPDPAVNVSFYSFIFNSSNNLLLIHAAVDLSEEKLSRPHRDYKSYIFLTTANIRTPVVVFMSLFITAVTSLHYVDYSILIIGGF